MRPRNRVGMLVNDEVRAPGAAEVRRVEGAVARHGQARRTRRERRQGRSGYGPAEVFQVVIFHGGLSGLNRGGGGGSERISIYSCNTFFCCICCCSGFVVERYCRSNLPLPRPKVAR